MNDFDRNFPSTAQEGLAMIDVIAYQEWMVSGAELIGADNVSDYVWLGNIPQGPNAEGAQTLENLLAKYGAENIRVGNAADPALKVPTDDPPPSSYAPRQVGVYIKAEKVAT